MSLNSDSHLVIIPTYNEIDNIPEFVSEISKFNVSVLFVDDNSPDKTGDVIKQYQIKNKKNLLDEILPKAFTNFEIGVSDRVTELEEKADFERQGEVIALMMYLGDPPELTEHLLVKNESKCLEMKQIAEETSFAYYECAIVDANLKGGKITSINQELKVLQWHMMKTIFSQKF